MRGRRANGEGTVRKRADGRWEARLAYADPNTGLIRRQSFYGQSASQVRLAVAQAQDRLADDAPIKDADLTVGAWIDRWIGSTLAVSDRKESTRELYERLARTHLQPEPFGTTRLDRLKPTDVEKLILTMRAKRRPHTERGAHEDREVRALSDSTIRSVYTVLRAVLDGAVRDGLLARNPAAAVKRPGIERTEARTLAPVDVAALLGAAQNSRHHTALVLIAATALRRGEALALRWEHVDLDEAVLKVRGTLNRVAGQLKVTEPKTQRSRRTVPLSPAVVAMLATHRQQQDQERAHAGTLWTETGFVFTTATGQPVDPRDLLRIVYDAAQQIGADGVGVHTLRHAAAATMLEAGVNIKAVSDLLGHSSIAITGDIYGHTSDQTARAAADLLTQAIGL